MLQDTPPAPPITTLDEVIVTAARLPPAAGEAAFSVIRLGEETLSTATRLDEALATVPAVIIVGRFFCGYFCSFGAVQDFLWFAGNKLKKRFRKAGAKNLHSNSKKSGRNVPTGWIKYGVLLFWAVFVWSGMIKWNIAGPWQVFGQYSSIGHWPGVKPLFSIGGALLLVIFVGSVLIQRFFCRYLCPMGAIYSLISRCALLKIVKPRSKCGSCRLCTAKCTMGIDLTEKEQMAGGECKIGRASCRERVSSPV